MIEVYVMDKIKVEFYRKLNEYYQECDYLFTRKSLSNF